MRERQINTAYKRCCSTSGAVKLPQNARGPSGSTRVGAQHNEHREPRKDNRPVSRHPDFGNRLKRAKSPAARTITPPNDGYIPTTHDRYRHRPRGSAELRLFDDLVERSSRAALQMPGSSCAHHRMKARRDLRQRRSVIRQSIAGGCEVMRRSQHGGERETDLYLAKSAQASQQGIVRR